MAVQSEPQLIGNLLETIGDIEIVEDLIDKIQNPVTKEMCDLDTV